MSTSLNLRRKFYVEIKCGKSKGTQEKLSIIGVWCGQENLSLGITVRHHSASLVMPISDPRDRFFYPYHTPMKDTYIINRPEISREGIDIT